MAWAGEDIIPLFRPGCVPPFPGRTLSSETDDAWTEAFEFTAGSTFGGYRWGASNAGRKLARGTVCFALRKLLSLVQD